MTKIIPFMLTAASALPCAAAGLPEPPRQNRPAWLRQEGIVVAGAWEALAYRLRGGGTEDFDGKMAAWKREHSEEMAQRLKEMGFNLVMIPLYKGFGLKAEHAAMEDTRRFTELCHRLGLRVGCYTFSGTVGYESIQAEEPGARDWLIIGPDGKYSYYDVKYYRRWVNRSHPGVRAHLREVVRYAVQEAKVDLIHLDNYQIGPGYEPYSVQQFREYLKRRYSPEERLRRSGFASMDFIEPPPPPPQPDRYNGDPLYQDFVDYRCATQADTYRELTEYARSLNPDIVMECNPHGYDDELNSYGLKIGTIDHTNLLQWGGAFWDEGYPSRLEDGRVLARFRSHMLGRQFGNLVFQYTSEPVAMAESMANNLQSLGCPVWFGGGKITPMASSRPLDPFLLDSIRFFHREQQYFRDTEQVADIGVLNTYENTAYGPLMARQHTAAFEQTLYQARMPFTLVPGRYPGDLRRFRAVVLADVALVSDKLVNAVRDYVRQGGGLVITGPAARFNEHNHQREQPAFANLFPEALGDRIVRAHTGDGRTIYIPRIVTPEKFQAGTLPENRGELLEAVRWAAGQPLQVEVKAPETVTMSLYQQPGGRRLLHLVNYDEAHPVSNIKVVMQVPAGRRIRSVAMLSPRASSSQRLTYAQDGRALRFSIPRLDVYGLVIME